MAPDAPPLGIGAVARAAGVSVEAVRYYEAEGLLSPARDPGGRRRYTEPDLTALAVVTALRKAGFGIAEIRDLLAVKNPDDPPVARIDAGLEALGRLDERLDERHAALDRARALLGRWRGDLEAGRAALTGGSPAG